MSSSAEPFYKMPTTEWLYETFRRVDIDGSGQISANELSNALSNGTWRPFSLKVVDLMITMFDRDGTRTIKFEEFKELWTFVTEWLNCFRSFDRDNSGSIDYMELRQALGTFGYRLSDGFYSLVMRKYDDDRKGSINFDDFIHLCVTLQRLTESFKQKDTDFDGVIRIGYEEFLLLVFNIC